MDLPTYTSIWRIEKRLYKLYDFRLPMPLPIGQITMFAAIAVPYVVLLTLLGLPFNHTLVWLYLIPPGAATWLVTRPVLEGKRLPELIKSQVRYLAEPRVWCRMAPLGESDVIVVTGRVWRLSGSARARMGRQAKVRQARAGQRRSKQVRAQVAAARRDQVRPGASRVPTGPVAQGHAGVFDRPALARSGSAPSYPGLFAPPARRPAAPAQPAASRQPAAPHPPVPQAPTPQASPVSQPPAPAVQANRNPAAMGPSGQRRPVRSPTAPPTRPAASARPPAATAPPAPAPPAVVRVTAGSPEVAPPALESALAGPGARRNDAKAGRVTVVPGGHRPGKPDQLQRDRARARLAIGGPRRVVVLGCTVGAGQTAIALLAGEVLASLRSDRVAVLDLNPGADSLAQQAQLRPALGQAASLGASRLTVLTAPAGPRDHSSLGQPEPDADPAEAIAAFEQAATTHRIVLADPATATVTRLMAIADQLVLVAPASAAAARAISMTFEWLDAHGQAGLAADAIMVMNGVSRRSMPNVEQAERVCIGRCRAIVRVPWDDQLKNTMAKRKSRASSGQQPGQQWAGLLSPGTVSACTALAGVLVAALAGPDAVAGDDGQEEDNPRSGTASGTGWVPQ